MHMKMVFASDQYVAGSEILAYLSSSMWSMVLK